MTSSLIYKRREERRKDKREESRGEERKGEKGILKSINCQEQTDLLIFIVFSFLRARLIT